MLSKEQAELALKAALLEDGPQRLVARMVKLPEAIRTPALTVMGRDVTGKNIEQDWQKVNQARSSLAKLKPAQQDALIDAWFPQFAPLVRSAVRRSRPYLNAYQSRPFRLKTKGSNVQLDEIGFGWLESVRRITENRDQPLRWYVEHGAYLGWGSDALAPVFAAAIDANEKDILEILIASGKNEHAVGMMGDHVTKSLLQASKPEGWEFVEKLLLAAQRQEGLRQSIFQAMFETHPTAFKRMLHLILEHDLIRFSSSVQALQMMMGWEGIEVTPKQLRDGLEHLLEWLEAIPKCVKFASNTTATPDELNLFQWLWCVATEDAAQAAADRRAPHDRTRGHRPARGWACVCEQRLERK
jgi:hypothetical protein